MSVSKQIKELKTSMDTEGIVPERGLGEELFLFSSSIAPIVNVDLLVFNEINQVLLSWRDDLHCGKGWHIPGGCVRFKEKLIERVHKTAISEFATDVVINEEPLKIFEIFAPGNRLGIQDQRERGHFITIVYSCSLVGDFLSTKNEGESGYLRWFDTLPDDLLEVQNCYKDNWEELLKRRKK